MTKLTRISEKAAKNLDLVSKMTGKTKQLVLEEALDHFTREQFIKKANEEYAEFIKNPKALEEELEEQSAWDTTLLDGLEND